MGPDVLSLSKDSLVLWGVVKNQFPEGGSLIDAWGPVGTGHTPIIS
jgi:hypothetical protein